MKRYYVYVHLGPCGLIRYVGKGCGKRARDFSQRNYAWREAFGSYKPEAIILENGLEEHEALTLEAQCIRDFRSAGYPIANIASNSGASRRHGGDNGLRGRIMPPEHRQKISEARLASDSVKASAHKVWETRRANGTASGFTTAKARAVICVETGATYRCATEAADAVGGSDKHIQACCVGRRDRHKKLHWRYAP